MAVYLGDSGFIELKRTAGAGALYVTLDPSDVNTERKRFSVDNAARSLITGDLVEVSTVDSSPLELVVGHVYPDGIWFVHIDSVGGIRLYETFEKALSGRLEEALELEVPSIARPIRIQTRNNSFRSVARIRDYEITTTREAVDTTLLGLEFRQQYEAGLISGQGNVSAFWEHSSALCGADSGANVPEFPVYLAQLVIRMQQGAEFTGRFFIYHDQNADDGRTHSVWYEADCVVTNVAVTVAVTQAIETRIEFVTSGTVLLRTGLPPSYLLQEDGFRLLREDGGSILLEDGT